MYQEPEIRNLSKQRYCLILPAMCFGAIAMFGYLGLLAVVRADVIAWAGNNFGGDAENWIMIPLIIPSIVIFLVPACIAEHKAKRYSISCPNCSRDLTQSVQKILKTRCCSNCKKRVVSNGKMRSSETYARYCQRRWRNYLVYWFWAWPICGIMILTWHALDSSAFRNCPHMIFLFGLIGTIATGWAFVRTNDRRYLAQTVTSTAVFALGISIFLQ